MKNTHRIVVDLDPGKDNGPAIARARAIAGADGSTVDLFVCDYLQWLSGDLVFTAENVDGAREEYFADLASWANKLGKPLEADGIEVRVHAAWHAPRHEALLEYANKVEADWIVRVASRRGALERLLLSATDWELIRQAKQLLWLVKSADSSLDRLRVLAAVDPTHPQDPEMKRDKRLLDTARRLCGDLNAELHVFHAWTAPMAIPLAPAGAAAADAAAAPIPRIDEKTLKAARERHRQCLDNLLAEYDIRRDRVHMTEGGPADAIEDVIDEHGIDVVVAGAVSRSWLQRFLIGSTAEMLFDAIECDLIVVKEDASVGDD
jgi:universal stress protein E